MNQSNKSDWANSFIINIPEIDEQHKKFFEMWDRASKDNSNKDFEELRSILQELEDYLNEHFAYEESLMTAAGYNDTESHKEMHRFFIDQVKQLKHKHSYLNPMLFSSIIEFMKKWFISHILQVDSKYKDIVFAHLKTKTE